MKQSDERLVELAVKGDAIAFRHIVERYQRDVLSTVIGILGNRQVVEDVAQETFVKLYKSLAQFEGRASLKTYVTRIAVNKSLDELRKRKRINSRETSLEMKTETQQFSDQVADTSDEQELVRIALEKLPEKYQEIVVLRMIKGYSTKETAEMLDLKYGTVLSRLSRAFDKMRLTLEPLYNA